MPTQQVKNIRFGNSFQVFSSCNYLTFKKADLFLFYYVLNLRHSIKVLSLTDHAYLYIIPEKVLILSMIIVVPFSNKYLTKMHS